MHLDMEFLFQYSTQQFKVSAENKRDIELNTSREILYLRAAMYYLFIIHKGGRVQELECGQGGGTRQGGWVDNGTVLC